MRCRRSWRLTSPRRFEVETESGERYFGHLDEPASDRMLRVVADDQVHDFDLDQVVRIYPIESKFLKRIDGFVSADTPYTGGEFTTRPLRFTGDRLVLNIDTGATGYAQVGILGGPQCLPHLALAQR